MKFKSFSKVTSLRVSLDALAVFAWMSAIQVGYSQSPPPPPPLAEQFRRLQNTWEEQTRPRSDGAPAPGINNLHDFIAGYVALAEAHPKDPVTCEALLWLNSRFRKMKGIDKAEDLARREWPLAGEYFDIKREHDEAEEKYFEASQKAANDEQRQKVYEENYPKPETFAGRFLALARKEPQSPPGKEALLWIIQRARQGADFDAALELALQHHARSPGIGPVCSSLVYSKADSAELFLREVAEKNPDTEAKGTAQLALARYLARKAEGIRFFKGGSLTPEQLAHAESYHGKERLAKLQATDPAALSDEAERLFAQVAAQYDSVRTHSGSLADDAKAELFEMRNLGIGKVAPEIEGEDVDGKKFKLSDYRGKVVVIDFWGDW